jgi:hypothetical protein
VTASARDPNFTRRPEVFGGGPTLVNNRGEPIPPYDVVERLARIDERLSIEWVDGAWGCAYFGLFERWRQGDPRWSRVQSGEVSEKMARDLVQMFPRSCPAPEMAAFVEHRWGNRAVGYPVAAAEAAVARAQQSLANAKEAAVDKAVSTSMDRFESESAHDRRMRSGNDTAHPMVSGHDFAEPKRLIEVVSK